MLWYCHLDQDPWDDAKDILSRPFFGDDFVNVPVMKGILGLHEAYSIGLTRDQTHSLNLLQRLAGLCQLEGVRILQGPVEQRGGQYWSKADPKFRSLMSVIVSADSANHGVRMTSSGSEITSPYDFKTAIYDVSHCCCIFHRVLFIFLFA